MWTFVSCNGSLYQPTGELLCTGYSGHGPGVNNPDMQNIENVGPIPVGLYLLGPLEENHEKLGKDVIALQPFAINQMFGRSGFFIHGDEMEHAGEYLASDGCIIAARLYRLQIAASFDKTLRVIAEPINE